jgi:DNA-binding NarL/FixJ family response regulator
MGTKRKLRALLADDHERMKSAVVRILGPAYDVTCVADGKELIEAVTRSKPDVMIVDISMPGMSGLDALRALQRLGESLPPTVVCSMHRDPSILEQALRAGASGYVYKARAPFELPEAIQAALENRRFVSREVASWSGISNS